MLAYEEMHKLTYYRSNLKVLITYNWDPSKTGDAWDFTFDRLCKNFKSTIAQANETSPENDATIYLLIFGQRIDQKLVWKFARFALRNRMGFKQIDIIEL